MLFLLGILALKENQKMLDVRQTIVDKHSIPVIPRKKNSAIGNADMD